tara:strand:+ start:253 stop:717 length:465 start_codon:yes stop_codon:yes gene_type:complete
MPRNKSRLKAGAAKAKIKKAASSVKGGLSKIGGVFSGIAKKTTAAAKKSTAKRAKATIFPSPHPKVKNADGSESHVKLSTFGFDGKEYVLPTMVDGKQLSNDEAIASAKKYGLSNYPSFSSLKKAEAWIAANHGKITGPGKGRSIPQPWEHPAY